MYPTGIPSDFDHLIPPQTNHPNESQTNPSNKMCHWGMAEWLTGSRTQEKLKKESTYYGQAYKPKDESLATEKSRHHVE
jgi:hypothetical protein